MTSVAQVGTPTATAYVTGTTTNQALTATNTFSGTQPRTAGHVLVMIINASATTSVAAITAPTGWSTAYNIGNTTTAHSRTACFWKYAVGSDSAPSVTVTTSGTSRCGTTLLELSGCNTSSPLDTTGTYASGATALTAQTTITVSGANSPANAGEYAIASFSREQAATSTTAWTTPSGWTSFSNDSTTSSALHNGIYYQSGPTPGTTLTCAPTMPSETTYSVGGMIVFVPSNPLMSSFSDNFSTNDLAANWDNSSGTYTWSAGKVAIQCDTSYSSALYTTNTYDLTGNSVYAKLGPYIATSAQTILQLSSGFGSYELDVGYSSNQLFAQYQYPTGTYVTIGSPITYNATSHAYVRVRESGGTVYFDSAPDGATWTNQWSSTEPFSVNNMVIGINTGDFGSDPTGTSYVYAVNAIVTSSSVSRIMTSYI